MIVMVFLVIFLYICDIPLNDAHCVDIHHHIVSQGLHYVPGPNPCTLCICDKGSPKWCKQVLCSPPENCKSFQVGNSCCEFKCLDDILSKSDNYSETYDLALRLIASAVTAVLSLSLLFFLIHRLRQRKIRLRQNRQLSEDQRSLNSIGYITGSLGYLPGSIGYLGSGNNELEFHYDESNVHYPLWKPPGNYFPRGEAPPPYEEAVRAARAEAELVNNHSQVTSTTTPYSFSSSRNENVSLTLVHNTHVSITPSVQQTGVTSSQCNVLLHQSNNLQSVQQDTRNDPSDGQNQTNSSTSVSLACDSTSSFLQNATLESQVDVHYENYNHNVSNATPVLTVSVKNEESFPKQALNVDFLRSEKAPNAVACTSNENTHGQTALKNETANITCNSWRRESAQNITKAISSSDIKQKLLDKSKNFKHVEAASAPSSSKSYRCDTQFVDTKYKKCNGTLKESSRKTAANKSFEKHRSQLKSHSDNHKEISLQDTGKHRTIPQKFSKTLETEMCYVNSTEIGKRKFDEEFTERCDVLLKQHNIDKARTTDKLDRKTLEKVVNSNSIKSSLCTTESRNAQKGIGMLKGDISTHRTLPKNLRELSEAFYFNFDNPASEELNLDCLVKKTLPRSSVNQSETPLSCVEKQIKSENSAQFSSNTLGRKYTQDKKSSNITNLTCSINPSYYRNQIETVKTVSEKIDTGKDAVEPELERDRTSVSYHCLSPAQDDMDDYRSECENCKSLSFEDCNDEEGDLLNETMTLQRRPMEQGEEHSFYRTSLTLPSHNKKTRSVTLNTPRESWFMAMQEMTSSSESD